MTPFERPPETMSKSADQELFERAMTGVKPLEDRDRALLPRRARQAGARPLRRAPVRGDSQGFVIERSGERMEGRRSDTDQRLLTRLKGGEYPPEDRRDLHGKTRREARQSVDQLLARARQRRHRCVLVIHGRGRGSTGGPVLKDAVVEWLSTPPWSRHVLAFASAPSSLGGPGALLLLLRRAS